MRLLPQLDVHSCPRLVILSASEDSIVEAMFSSLSHGLSLHDWLLFQSQQEVQQEGLLSCVTEALSPLHLIL